MKEIFHGNNLQVMRELPSNSVDAIVTDPPYGLKFMGKKWDYDVPSVDQWKECLRVLKPGGYLLSFAGTRTQHRMACNIEDAGFEIRDMIAWVYGSGFPKSLNVGKAIDDLLGNERQIISGTPKPIEFSGKFDQRSSGDRVKSIGENEFEGWGTALKPALEPITMARKPLSEKTIAENILKWGVGGINIDGCRVEWDEKGLKGDMNRRKTPRTDITGAQFHASTGGDNAGKYIGDENSPKGRFPANFIHDGDQLVLDLFPNNAGAAAPVSRGMNGRSKGIYGDFGQKGDDGESFRNDSGSAARFFYCAKASRSERNLGCEDMEEKPMLWSSGTQNPGSFQSDNTKRSLQNNHPTVKPLKLMQYLIKLVSKENATILDPWAGSGTTILACITLNRQYIGIEMDEHFYGIIKKRVEYFEKELTV
jgi:site-specific DNA-methyltransferase (adenine-specific)